MGAKCKDITGMKFGKLTPLENLGKLDEKNVFWLCECDCGKQKTVKRKYLTGGVVSSCGCLLGKGRIKKAEGDEFGLEILVPKDAIKLLVKKGNMTVTEANNYYKKWRKEYLTNGWKSKS